MQWRLYELKIHYRYKNRPTSFFGIHLILVSLDHLSVTVVTTLCAVIAIVIVRAFRTFGIVITGYNCCNVIVTCNIYGNVTGCNVIAIVIVSESCGYTIAITVCAATVMCCSLCRTVCDVIIIFSTQEPVSALLLKVRVLLR